MELAASSGLELRKAMMQGCDRQVEWGNCRPRRTSSAQKEAFQLFRRQVQQCHAKDARVVRDQKMLSQWYRRFSNASILTQAKRHLSRHMSVDRMHRHHPECSSKSIIRIPPDSQLGFETTSAKGLRVPFHPPGGDAKGRCRGAHLMHSHCTARFVGG